MALERVVAVETPFPLPDMSSPNNNFANLSFIISNSAKQFHTQLINQKYIYIYILRISNFITKFTPLKARPVNSFV